MKAVYLLVLMLVNWLHAGIYDYKGKYLIDDVYYCYVSKEQQVENSGKNISLAFGEGILTHVTRKEMDKFATVKIFDSTNYNHIKTHELENYYYKNVEIVGDLKSGSMLTCEGVRENSGWKWKIGWNELANNKEYGSFNANQMPYTSQCDILGDNFVFSDTHRMYYLNRRDLENPRTLNYSRGIRTKFIHDKLIGVAGGDRDSDMMIYTLEERSRVIKLDQGESFFPWDMCVDKGKSMAVLSQNATDNCVRVKVYDINGFQIKEVGTTPKLEGVIDYHIKGDLFFIGDHWLVVYVSNDFKNYYTYIFDRRTMKLVKKIEHSQEINRLLPPVNGYIGRLGEKNPSLYNIHSGDSIKISEENITHLALHPTEKELIASKKDGLLYRVTYDGKVDQLEEINNESTNKN